MVMKINEKVQKMVEIFVFDNVSVVVLFKILQFLTFL